MGMARLKYESAAKVAQQEGEGDKEVWGRQAMQGRN